MRIVRFILLLTVFCASISTAHAQASCDKLFATGVKLQQTMTVASQKKAITYFEKAKICYDSKTKKNLCDQQIKACRNIIAQLSKKVSTKKTAPATAKENEEPAPAAKDPEPKKVVRDVKLSLDCTYLKFKGKGGEFKKAKVTCNYPDWKITEIPEWVNCSRNENNEIVVEVTKNPSTKEERSGVVKIECDQESVSLTIIQEKFKKFIII
ncbi:MAG: BACON domain-containing protein [Prevotella sp.]